MNLFAYGTLMWPEVLGRRLEGTTAVLEGYTRLRVKGEHYPVVISDPANLVTGVLYLDLSEREFEHLDAFEGEAYDRLEVTVDGITAFAYVLSKDWMHIADSCPWEPEQLGPEHLAAFCAEYKGWGVL